MAAKSLEKLLTRLEEAKVFFGRGHPDNTEKLLTEIARRKFADPLVLIRFHEAVLFIRAYPASKSLLRTAESILSGFAERVRLVASAGQDLSEFGYENVSGID